MQTSLTQPRSRPLRRRRLAADLLSHAVLLLAAVVIAYPIAWMVLASLKGPGELFTNMWGLPRQPAWDNYRAAWEAARLGTALRNSIVMSLGSVLLVLLIAAPAGYAFAKFRFRFATPLFLLFVLTMQAPVPFIPLYVLLTRLRLTDSLLGILLIVSANGLPLAIFIFRAFFVGVPADLTDAAVVDGCTAWGAFRRIVLPISTPAVGTIAILQFLNAWNEYFLTLILLRSPGSRTLPLALQVFFYSFGRTEWTHVFAALTIGAVPIIVVYVLMQRQFVRGLTAGAIKG